ncbi:MAG: copper homeostasis protein CutC [Paramuribaculum sp.]|nr:copper homeostasis protein CutC [Paramuribaculum sp.]
MDKHLLEICAADIESVRAAAKGGADRVELCCDLAEGGLTPSAGLISESLKVTGIKINVLIRPRPGDFVYTDDEIKVMLADIIFARESGVDGIVIGALTNEGDIDILTCKRLIEAAHPLPVTFHRAFDQCRNPSIALEQIISLGCNRLLTSGQAPTAMEGTQMLSTLVNQANDRISIMAGSGVNPKNAEILLHATNVPELHASARTMVSNSVKPLNDTVSMGTNRSADYIRHVTSAELVRQLATIVHSFNS